MDASPVAERRADCLVRGMVSEVEPAGVVRVVCGDREVGCYVLHGSDSPLTLFPGDEVLVLLPGSVSEVAVVMGRVAPASVPDPDEPALDGTGTDGADLPDELVLEARSGVILRCGESSITIREDGKVLIKGSDLVSHARRTNRIRGGSVAIN